MSKLKKAMEKAKQARGSNGTDHPPEDRGSPAAPPREKRSRERMRQEVSPEYYRTRRIEVNPSTLKRNRIISLFYEEAMTDQFKILHTQILNKTEELGGNSILVTSPNPGEGKTTTAINLAVSISRKVDRTVLLVDGNIRKPTIHRFLGLQETMGLADYLLGQAEIPDLLINPGIEKLVILPGGTPLTNSLELLGSPRMELLAEEMKGRYEDRLIIFDGPCLLSYADPQVLSGYADGILLVIESEKTDRKDVEKAQELLAGKQIVGTVLNKSKG